MRGFQVRARFNKYFGRGEWSITQPLTWSQAKRLSEALSDGGELDVQIVESRGARRVRKIMESWKRIKNPRAA